MTPIFRALMTGVAILAGGAASAAECIAPANPGGGLGFSRRQIGKIIPDIGKVGQPVQVTNLAGAGGGRAFKTVVNERDDAADLIVAATVTRLAQDAFGGSMADPCASWARSSPIPSSSSSRPTARSGR